MRDCDFSTTPNRALLAGWQAPDMLGVGVMVCDASSRVLIANETAGRILKDREILELSPEGFLSEVGSGRRIVAEAVRKCAAAATSTHESRSESAIFLPGRDGNAGIELRVRPFRAKSMPSRERAMSLIVVLESPASNSATLGMSRYGEQYENQPYSDLLADPSRV